MSWGGMSPVVLQSLVKKQSTTTSNNLQTAQAASPTNMSMMPRQSLVNQPSTTHQSQQQQQKQSSSTQPQGGGAMSYYNESVAQRVNAAARQIVGIDLYDAYKLGNIPPGSDLEKLYFKLVDQSAQSGVIGGGGGSIGSTSTTQVVSDIAKIRDPAEYQRYQEAKIKEAVVHNPKYQYSFDFSYNKYQSDVSPKEWANASHAQNVFASRGFNEISGAYVTMTPIVSNVVQQRLIPNKEADKYTRYAGASGVPSHSIATQSSTPSVANKSVITKWLGVGAIQQQSKYVADFSRYSLPASKQASEVPGAAQVQRIPVYTIEEYEKLTPGERQQFITSYISTLSPATLLYYADKGGKIPLTLKSSISDEKVSVVSIDIQDAKDIVMRKSDAYSVAYSIGQQPHAKNMLSGIPIVGGFVGVEEDIHKTFLSQEISLRRGDTIRAFGEGILGSTVASASGVSTVLISGLVGKIGSGAYTLTATALRSPTVSAGTRLVAETIGASLYKAGEIVTEPIFSRTVAFTIGKYTPQNALTFMSTVGRIERGINIASYAAVAVGHRGVLGEYGQGRIEFGKEFVNVFTGRSTFDERQNINIGMTLANVPYYATQVIGAGVKSGQTARLGLVETVYLGMNLGAVTVGTVYAVGEKGLAKGLGYSSAMFGISDLHLEKYTIDAAVAGTSVFRGARETVSKNILKSETRVWEYTRRYSAIDLDTNFIRRISVDLGGKLSTRGVGDINVGRLGADTKQDIGRNDISRYDYKQSIGKFDIRQDIRPDIRPDIRQDIRQDIRYDIGKIDIRPDIRTDIRQDIRQDIGKMDIRMDLRPDYKVSAPGLFGFPLMFGLGGGGGGGRPRVAKSSSTDRRYAPSVLAVFLGISGRPTLSAGIGIRPLSGEGINIGKRTRKQLGIRQKHKRNYKWTPSPRLYKTNRLNKIFGV